MSILTISDVHIKKVNDKAYLLFMSFLEKAKSEDVETVFFLGDIFDLMVGEHQEYIEAFPELFLNIKEIARKKRVYFLEGNHDFHLESILIKYIDSPLFEYSSGAKILKYQKQVILFCHGDDIELGNLSYKFYKFLIRSRFVKMLAVTCLKYETIKWIGDWASNRSRQRHVNRYSKDLDEFIKAKFRDSAIVAADRYLVNGVVAGHSHMKDLFMNEEFVYMNNGYFPMTGLYGKISKNGWELKSLL